LKSSGALQRLIILLLTLHLAGHGPYIAVLKTHIDYLIDWSPQTTESLVKLSQQHDFLIFEDRKFIDIGNTVQGQYRGSFLQYHQWAHIVNASVLPGEGIIQALDQSIREGGISDRGVLILAEMTSKGSYAKGDYTQGSVEIARKYPETVLGFVSTRELSRVAPKASEEEDFVVFTTGVNMSSKGDGLGQQYQTPETAMAGGSDFLIAGRGIYAAADPVAAVKEYRRAGWEAYERRLGTANKS
jgi:orotidine-5'-phosphate decarboxylase